MKHLECLSLEKSFGPQKVLDKVSFSVEHGDIYGFLGPNGAGKSTTIRIIADLIRADAGSVHIDGIAVAKKKVEALSSVGMLIEKPSFYPHLSGETNLRLLTRLMPEIEHSEIDRVLKIVDLSSAALKKVKFYSQGMKQRLGIAQAMMGHPSLIILDEPLNGLDPVSMRDMRDLIFRLRDEGKTIFLSSHLLYEVERSCNRMCIIRRGTVIREGAVRELLYDVPEYWVEFSALNSADLEQAARAHFDADRIRPGLHGLLIKMKQEQIPDFINTCVSGNIRLRAASPLSTLEDYFLSIMES